MNKDEKEALQRIEQELLKEEAVPEELQPVQQEEQEEQDYLESIKALLGEEPASMEQTMMFQIPENLVKTAQEDDDDFAEYRDSNESENHSLRGDTRMTVLIIIAILLTLGILGVLLRWLLLLLK